MKPHHLSGDSSLIRESKMTIGEKLRRAYATTMTVMVGDTNPNQRGNIKISKEIERRNGRSGLEDPLRTMMFLGSWSHT
ncbi:hypothetical protein DCAR_0102947 [Daucus carota subsp. sativus]|uniref:Uncharacterized protein n=1 Tax=Daucus carota subsp. sativus TaxID=79200 RepID=A0A166HEJ7_DAUCS|nr:hypothetical protein DCAR_0102947 [Daucus carota subsp. sativus]